MEKRYKKSDANTSQLPSIPQEKETNIFDSEGVPDVRKMTGAQVLGMLHGAGLKVPIPSGLMGPKLVK